MNKSAIIHTFVIVAVGCLSGYETSRGNYGWAVTFGLMFFAVLVN